MELLTDVTTNVPEGSLEATVEKIVLKNWIQAL